MFRPSGRMYKLQDGGEKDVLKKTQQSLESKPLGWAYSCVIRALCVVLVGSVLATHFALISLRVAFPDFSALSGRVEALDGHESLDRK